jgi:hypothetical protein
VSIGAIPPEITIEHIHLSDEKVLFDTGLPNFRLLKPYLNALLNMGNSTLEDHIQFSDRANVVIGPHGAGFSNLVFCKPKHSLLK